MQQEKGLLALLALEALEEIRNLGSATQLCPALIRLEFVLTTGAG